jgi:DNA-binding NtrC family response regulator
MFTDLFKKITSREKTIFIVEDNEMYAKLLQEYLMLRFPEIQRIKIFPFGEACLMELYQDPTVIIMDHLLNSKNADAATGLSIIKKIKTVSSNTNIILLSAQTELEVAAKALSKYGCVYLQKDDKSFEKVEYLIKKIFKQKRFSFIKPAA